MWRMDSFGNDPAGDRINPVALVTGAASGIGLATMQRLAAKAQGGLILVDLDEGALSDAADSLLNPPERVSTLAFDVSDPARWRAASDFIADQYGRLDWAVVNAGVSYANSITDTSYEDWRRVMSVNLDGAFLTMRAAMPLMRANQQGGAIVVVSSASGVKAEPGVGAYGASKAGLLQHMRVAAKEGAPDGIRVNAVTPGGVETPMWRDVPMFQDLVAQTGSERAAFDRIAAMATPMGRYASADDIARLIDFLLTDPSPITGASLGVDGGYTL
jgi:NAD(P)-dependent dehydrogenase (short-subunit alcohol dehydrogenase family)